MNFKTLTPDQAFLGTHLVGYITTTRGTLEEVFGAPTWDEPSWDGKVTTEWRIEYAGGVIATIYDYKRYEEGAPGHDEMYEWHIGGESYDAVNVIEKTLFMAGKSSSYKVDWDPTQQTA